MLSLNSNTPSRIIIETGRPCITTYGSAGDSGVWYWRCWQRREQWCGPMGCYIRCYCRWCSSMGVIVGWWHEQYWNCWRGYITEWTGGSWEWQIGVQKTESGSTSRWLIQWRRRGYGQSRYTSRFGRPPLRHKWPSGKSMRGALGQNGCRGMAGWWGGGTRTWEAKKNNPEQSVV